MTRNDKISVLNGILKGTRPISDTYTIIIWNNYRAVPEDEEDDEPDDENEMEGFEIDDLI